MEEYEHVTENKVNTKNHILRALFLFMKLVINVGLFKKTLCGLLVWIKTHIKYYFSEHNAIFILQELLQ